MPRSLRLILGSLALAASLTLLYLISWTLAFVIMLAKPLGGDGVNFNFYYDYLVLFWTGQGGELPFFCGVGSIFILIVLSFLERRRLILILGTQRREGRKRV